MAKKRGERGHERRSERHDNKVIQGVTGFILSVLGLLLAFQIGAESFLLFALFLVLIIIGIILVAKALSD